MVPTRPGRCRPRVRVRSLIGEVDDGQPSPPACARRHDMSVNPVSEEFCRRAKTQAFTREELRPLTRAE